MASAEARKIAHTGFLPKIDVNVVNWEYTKLAKSIFNKIKELYGHVNEETYYGAPKMFYDEPSDQYMITWHAGKTGNDSDTGEWETKRTFYILTKDFKSFSDPKLLFNFTGSDESMATIDVIIRHSGDSYYAIFKDERTQEVAPETGKTIRIAKAPALTGPYANPGARITDLARWHEAPIIVPTVDGKGFYLFTENYPLQYDMFEAQSLDGPWTLVTSNAEMPEIFWQKKLCHFSAQLICQHFSYMIGRTFMILPVYHCNLHIFPLLFYSAFFSTQKYNISSYMYLL